MPRTRRPFIALVTCVLLLAACGSSEASTAGAPETTELPKTTDRPATTVPGSSSGDEHTTSGLVTRAHEALTREPDEPVFDGDFADPAAIVSDRTVYAFATNTAEANVPLGMATLRGGGTLGDDALPEVAAWSDPGWVWAPAVIDLGPDDFRLYYSTIERDSGRQCISVASGTAPGGPFVDDSTEPLVCQLEEGGSIDPSPIVIDGQLSLVWKSDGNCCLRPTWIWSAPLTPDGTGLAGDPVQLLRDDQDWEGGVIEAPSMVDTGDELLLFYSGNDWASDSYAIGWARCESVAGPCEKPSDDPLLASSEDISGPGGAHAFIGPSGQVSLIYHAWLGDDVGYESGGVRALFVEPVQVEDGVPTLPRR